MALFRKPSQATSRLLAALAEDPSAWRHGYELLGNTGLKSGTLYPLLIRLHEQGLVDAAWQPPVAPGRPPRHAYRITPAGLEAAAAIAAGAAGPAASPARPLTT